MSAGGNTSSARRRFVCGALSVELYLKLIYLLTKGELAPASHSLRNLFKSLDGKTQEICARHHRYSLKAKELRSYLEPMSEAFETWRYVHEREFAISWLSDFENVAEALHQAVKEIEPGLASVFDGPSGTDTAGRAVRGG